MGFTVTGVKAVEILDSRSRPTLAVTVTLGDGTVARAGVPSGASTGSQEAVELRDGDTKRFGGSGVLGAVGNVNGEIAEALRGRTFTDLAELDHTLIDLDGTDNKSRLGANAVVGVSMAAARGLAIAAGLPLWQTLNPTDVTPRLPVPHFNVVNGGVHAPNDLDFQEFMVARSAPRPWRKPSGRGPRSTPPCEVCLWARDWRQVWVTRGASHRRSANLKKSSVCSSKRSRVPATSLVGTGSRSLSIPPRASSIVTAPTRSPGRRFRAMT